MINYVKVWRVFRHSFREAAYIFVPALDLAQLLQSILGSLTCLLHYANNLLKPVS